MKFIRPFLTALAAVLGCLTPATAQVPDTLKYPILAPPVGVQSGAQLGYSVAVEGGYAVIGAPFDDTGGQDSGVVKVFDSATGALLFILPNPSPALSDQFGSSVAISGSRVVVGDYQHLEGISDLGKAYVYDLSSANPTVPVATLATPNPAGIDEFGSSVAISGSRVVVGAPRDNTGKMEAGSSYVYDLNSGTPTVPIATLRNPTPAVSDFFGTAVAISGTRVLVGANRDDTGAIDTGSAYVYDLTTGTPTVPVFTLNNPTPGVQDYFGSSVAISGTRVVVGAYQDATGAFSAGSAYVYDLGGGTPTVPVATLNNPSPAVQDFFGNAVAISGARVVVGARGDDQGAADAGSAYVYDLSSATPTVPVATLNNPGPAASDSFGFSVAIDGTRVLAGAYRDDTGATDAGSAYGYDLNTGTPGVPVSNFTSLSPSVNDSFGASTAISGTLLVVGSPLENTGATKAGSVYVYDLSSGTPTVPVVTLNNPNPVASDQFGFSVGISGTLVVGIARNDTPKTSAGTVYVYDLRSGTPTVPIVTLNNPSPAAGDFFGLSVAISGARVVVGALEDDTAATNAGSVYVYDLSEGMPTIPLATLNNPSPAAGDFFGNAVAISGTRVVVGASGDDSGATNAGSVYVYDLGSSTPTVPTATLNKPGSAANDAFGYSVAISGSRVVVGAYQDDTGATDAGSVYIYDLNSATPTLPVVTLNDPTPAVGDVFGSRVAISGSRVVVGATQDSTGAIDAGSAYVYDLSGGTPQVPVATLRKSSPSTSDFFSSAVAIEGSTVAIGALLDDTVTANKGAVYVFGPASNDTNNNGLLDLWEYAKFGTLTGHLALGDTDGDGTKELVEEAFNTDPLLPTAAAAPAPVVEGGFLTLTVNKRAGVTYVVESAGTPLAADFSSTTTTVLTNTAAILKVRDNVPATTAGGRFMHVRVTAAP